MQVQLFTSHIRWVESWVGVNKWSQPWTLLYSAASNAISTSNLTQPQHDYDVQKNSVIIHRLIHTIHTHTRLSRFPPHTARACKVCFPLYKCHWHKTIWGRLPNIKVATNIYSTQLNSIILHTTHCIAYRLKLGSYTGVILKGSRCVLARLLDDWPDTCRCKPKKTAVTPTRLLWDSDH